MKIWSYYSTYKRQSLTFLRSKLGYQQNLVIYNIWLQSSLSRKNISGAKLKREIEFTEIQLWHYHIVNSDSKFFVNYVILGFNGSQ